MRASDVLTQIGKSSRQAAAEIGISKTMLLNFLNHSRYKIISNTRAWTFQAA